MKMNNLKTIVGTVAFIFITVVFLLFIKSLYSLFFVGCVIPPVPETLSSQTETMVRIHMYLKKHEQFPKSLEDLPRRENYANSIHDGWGRKLLYSIENDNIIKLKSYGKDGKPGGTGNNQDIRGHPKTLLKRIRMQPS